MFASSDPSITPAELARLKEAGAQIRTLALLRGPSKDPIWNSRQSIVRKYYQHLDQIFGFAPDGEGATI